jgi:aspartyl-tRNA(Asn)/glutamyl-tRNA(Gln) amidotransferase subunit A
MIEDLLASYRSGVRQPSEEIRQTLDRLRLADARLGILGRLTADQALAAAADSDHHWRAGTARPLEGVPFAVKDIIQVEGSVTAFGSPLFENFQPAVTATAVERLRAAGAILVAKLATWEFACIPNDDTRNPWDITRSPGGSSSGSASAVGAGLVPLALGTDTGGSIRVPAAWCGAVGLKATYGRISCAGVAPLSWTLDHVGPLTTSVADAAYALRALAGFDPADPNSVRAPVEDWLAVLDEDIAGLTVGRPADWFFEICQPEVVSVVDGALDRLRSLGVRVVPVEIPLLRELNPDTVKRVLIGAENASAHEANFGRLSGYGKTFASTVARSRELTAVDYLRAVRTRSIIEAAIDESLANVDALVMPTACRTAPALGDDWVQAASRNTSVFNISRHPALSVPCGLSPADGLPIGLQIVAAPWREDICLRLGQPIFGECQPSVSAHRWTPLGPYV